MKITSEVRVIRPSVRGSGYLSIRLFVDRIVRPSVDRIIHPFVRGSGYPSARPGYLSIHGSGYPSVRM